MDERKAKVRIEHAIREVLKGDATVDQCVDYYYQYMLLHARHMETVKDESKPLDPVEPEAS